VPTAPKRARGRRKVKRNIPVGQGSTILLGEQTGEAAHTLNIEEIPSHTHQVNAVLDGTAGLWCCNAGHGRRKIVEAVQAQVAQLDEIPGIGITAAQDLLAEIGTDMSRFPTPGHLVSWAKFAPKARQSAGRSKAAATGKGNPWLGGTLGEAATSAARTKTFLASRYKRIARRRGKQRALVAVGNSILTIIWHLLSDPAAHFTDLGPDWHDRLAPLRRKRQLIAELERLSGKKVTLHDAA